MIRMSSLLRTLNCRIFCTYSVIRSLHRISVASSIYSARLPQFKQRGLLSAVYSATDISLAKMSSGISIKNATYNDIIALINSKNVLLIDVREPSELKETGILPGSINIPGEIENVLKNTPPDEFVKRFGLAKPDFNFPLIFSCRSGHRSTLASDTAVKLGFKDVTNYKGGWNDWEQHLKM